MSIVLFNGEKSIGTHIQGMRPAEDIRRANALLIYSNDSDNLESRMKTDNEFRFIVFVSRQRALQNLTKGFMAPNL
jgi:hypothetical protein